MALSKALNSTAAFLENYWGRNQVYRTVQFASMLVAGLMKHNHENSAEKWLRIATAISDMRVLLRLTDDIPVLVHTLRNWRSCTATKNDKLYISNLIEFINALSGQLYYPVEHLAWAADNKLIPVSSTRLWTVGILLWGLSLLISLYQATRKFIQVRCELSKASSKQNSSINSEISRKRVSFQDETIEHSTISSSSSPSVQNLKNQQLLAALTVVQSLSDLMNAIHWLPEGFLWAGKLSMSWVGFFGTVSSLIGLYKILPSPLP